MSRQPAASNPLPATSASPMILASGSPRRKRLLELIGISFEIVTSNIKELPRDGESPSDFALRAAHEKALDVASRHPDRLVLGADTVVEIAGVILGKPGDSEDAERMLRSLSGRDHLVHTGVALAVAGKARGLLDTASVSFSVLDDDIISWYVGSGEPMDKAGAYAIQGIGGLLVTELRGSPHTVVGLPIHRLPELFAAQGLEFWKLLTSHHR